MDSCKANGTTDNRKANRAPPVIPPRTGKLVGGEEPTTMSTMMPAKKKKARRQARQDTVALEVTDPTHT